MHIYIILCCACMVMFRGLFFTVTSYSSKVSTMVFFILLQVHKVKFLNR